MENQNVCRLCLRLPSKLLPLCSNTDLTEKIYAISSIKVLPYDNLPDKICEECTKNVNKFCNFRKVIINSDIELREKLQVLSVSKTKAARKTSEAVMLDVVSKTIESSEIVKNEVKIETIETARSVINSQFATANKSKTTSETLVTDGDECNSNKSNSVKSEINDVNINTLSSVNENSDNEKRNISVKLIRYVRRQYKCNLCDFSCKESTKFQNHNRTFHYAKGVCNICGKAIRADNLRKHIINHNSTPVNCKECGKVFKNNESLRSHMFLHKGVEYSCEICGKVYNYKGELTRHMKQKHEGEKPQKKQKCPFCDKAFPYRNGLIRHLQSHTGERPHVCQYCKKGFYSTYALKVHVRQHTNEKPFICEYCPMAFPQKVSLVTHIMSKHKSDTENV